MADSKTLSFSKPPILSIFCQKLQGMVLEWVRWIDYFLFFACIVYFLFFASKQTLDQSKIRFGIGNSELGITEVAKWSAYHLDWQSSYQQLLYDFESFWWFLPNHYAEKIENLYKKRLQFFKVHSFFSGYLKSAE